MSKVIVLSPNRPLRLDEDEVVIENDKMKEYLLRRGAMILEDIWGKQVLPAIAETIGRLTQTPPPEVNTSPMFLRKSESRVFLIQKKRNPREIRAECFILASNISQCGTAVMELNIASTLNCYLETPPSAELWTVSSLEVFGTIERKGITPYTIPPTYFLLTKTEILLQNVKDKIEAEKITKFAEHIVLSQNESLHYVEEWVTDVWSVLNENLASPIEYASPKESITAKVRISPYFSTQGEIADYPEVQALILHFFFPTTVEGTITKDEHSEEKVVNGTTELRLSLFNFTTKKKKGLNIFLEFSFDFFIKDIKIASISLPSTATEVNLPNPNSIISDRNIEQIKECIISLMKKASTS